METLGPYELLDVVGQGGMGRVYRARDTRYDRTVALKVMGAEALRQPEFEKLFRREADLITRLNSPHIVPIHGYGEVDGVPYLDMRYVEGHSLSSVVKDYGPASLDTAIGLLAQAAQALDDAHNAGVVHRDVKPANLLIDRGGFVYLADFGIAVAVGHRGTEGGKVFGSWPYMAPERFTGEEVGPESDIYSLACVLHYALTGRPPFVGEGMEALRDQHLHRPPPSLVGVPDLTPQVDDVVRWALAKNPADRPSSARAWIRALKDAVARRPQPYVPSPAELANVSHYADYADDDGARSAWLIALLVVLVILAGGLAALIATGGP